MAVTVATWPAVLIALVPIALVIYYLVVKSGKMISWEFLTARIP